MDLVKSRQRVMDHGEVFTPLWLVDSMLNLVQAESERIDSRVLEPACGSGNFLTRVLERKLATVDSKYMKSNFERQQYALLALMCIYGVELLEDNAEECRQNLLAVFAAFLSLSEADDMYRAAEQVLRSNIVHGDAMSMSIDGGEPITFPEWGYLGKGKFQRRDFRLDTLAQMSAVGEDTLFADIAKHDVFSPVKTYPPLTVEAIGRG